MNILELFFNLDEFSNNVSKTFKFSFCARSKNNFLFSKTLGYKVKAIERCKTANGTMIFMITYLTSVIIGTKLIRGGFGKLKTIVKSIFKKTKNVCDKSLVNCCWSIHVLTCYNDYI